MDASLSQNDTGVFVPDEELELPPPGDWGSTSTKPESMGAVVDPLLLPPFVVDVAGAVELEPELVSKPVDSDERRGTQNPYRQSAPSTQSAQQTSNTKKHRKAWRVQRR